MWLCPTPSGNSDSTHYTSEFREGDGDNITDKEEDERNISQMTVTPSWLCPTVPSDDDVTMDGVDSQDNHKKGGKASSSNDDDDDASVERTHNLTADDSYDADHHSLESIPESPDRQMMYAISHSASNHDNDGISHKNGNSITAGAGLTTMSLGSRSWTTTGSGMNIHRTVSESSHFSANANSLLNPVLWENPSSVLAPGMVTIERPSTKEQQEDEEEADAMLITPQTSPGSLSSEELTFQEATSTSMDEEDVDNVVLKKTMTTPQEKAATMSLLWRIIQIVAVIGLFAQINPAVVDSVRSMLLTTDQASPAAVSTSSQMPLPQQQEQGTQEDRMVEQIKVAAKLQQEKAARRRRQAAVIPESAGGIEELLDVIQAEDPEQPILQQRRRPKVTIQVPVAGGLNELLETIEEDDEEENEDPSVPGMETDMEEVETQEEEQPTPEEQTEEEVPVPEAHKAEFVIDQEVKQRADAVLDEMELDDEVKRRAKEILESYYKLDQELSQRWKSPTAMPAGEAIEELKNQNIMAM